MARIRSVKPEFWTSEQIAECSANARLLFIGLWNFCDDYGVHPASYARLKMEIFPADSFNSDDIRRMVAELVANKLITEYVIDGEAFWFVTGWDKHQKPDTKTGKWPRPDGTIGGKIRRKIAEDSPNEQRQDGERSPPELVLGSCSLVLDSSSKDTPPEKSGGRTKKSAIEIKTFIANCKESGEKAIPDDDPIFQYAEEAGIPTDHLRLCWREFVDRMSDGKIRKADWRAHFRNCVRSNWYKLWYIGENGYELTTTGKQAQLKHGRAAA